MPLFPNQIPPSRKKLIIYTLVVAAIFLLLGLLVPKRDMPQAAPSHASTSHEVRAPEVPVIEFSGYFMRYTVVC